MYTQYTYVDKSQYWIACESNEEKEWAPDKYLLNATEKNVFIEKFRAS